MKLNKVKIGSLKGVGSVELDLEDKQRVYAFIGVNGIGKTKTLEALFQVLFFSNNIIRKVIPTDWIPPQLLVFGTFETEKQQIISQPEVVFVGNFVDLFHAHTKPVIYLASQNRGFINHNDSSIPNIRSFKQRRQQYFQSIVRGMSNNFTSLNMNVDIEDWFAMLAQSSNKYQQQSDNRDIEIKTVLKLLHEIDPDIDPDFMEISGDGRVSLKISGQKRELSHLSTGFASILKIIQTIVSGYGYFTNETQLQNVTGIVLIDEIESHLHISWQTHIISLLKRLFPHTVFYVTTNSPLVLVQLNQGEAYRLERDSDNVVRSKKINHPNTAAFIDVMNDAFEIDLNRIKIDNTSPERQKDAKRKLLDLLSKQWEEQGI